MPKTQRQKRQGRVWTYRPLLAIVVFFTTLATAGVGLLAVGYILLGLPDLSSLASYRPSAVTEVLDANGQPIAYWYKEKRWPVPRAKIPDKLVKAFVAAEDARFYEHPGIDFMGVLRAMVKNVEAGAIVQGASTITQQVTRSLLLTPERSWIRKVKEALLAWQIDARLTKDEILTLYLNQIYLGQGAYGVEAASRTYFGKHVDQLNLAECAILAGLPQAPSRYSPTKNWDLARKRQLYTLRRMVEEGFITPAEAEQAKETSIRFHSDELVVPPEAEYFVAEVRKEMERRYGADRLLTDGLTVVTTLRPDWQEAAYKAAMDGLKALDERHPSDKALPKTVQVALMSMDLDTGAVRAMIGGKDFDNSQFNRATQGTVQPGSSFKPVVYTAAMLNGKITPETVLVDEPISLPGAEPGTRWEPKNFEKTYMGPITIRTALTYSRNIISVKVAKLVGIRAIHDTARKLGITTPLANNLSIALGSSGIHLAELIQAYSAFPNEGATVTPQYIQEVRDRDGRVLEKLEPERHKAIDPVVAYQMLNLLEGVVQNGTGQYAKQLGLPAGGKTGTTDNYHDALFLGFTPKVVTGVWVGRQDRQSLGRLETGGRVACPIWTQYMEVTKKEPLIGDFPIPDGVVLAPMDASTGDIVVPTPDKDEGVVWEAMREDELPILQPSSGRFKLPSWLKRLDDFFFSR